MVKKERERTESIEFEVPKSLADRIRTTHGIEPVEIAKEAVLGFYEDHRRKSIAVKRMGIGWHPEVYKAMLKHCSKGSVSIYVREIVYRELSKIESGLVPYEGGREIPHKDNKLHRKLTNERNSIVVPMLLPQQWFDRLDARLPGKVSTWIKCKVQLDIEKKVGKELPVLRGMHAMLDDGRI